MPVRSLNSSVLVWPDAKAVEQAVRQWVREHSPQKPEMIRAGYFGSYARGDWGVGSDLDLVILVERADEPFERRAVHWDLTQLPVPAEVLVYTVQEWEWLTAHTGFGKTLSGEAVWVYEKASHTSCGSAPA